MSQAAAAIHNYGALAEPALLGLLKSDSTQEKVAACRFLDTVGTERCLPALREATRDPDPHVAGLAGTAIKIVEQRLGLEPEAVEKPRKAQKPQPSNKSPRQKSSRPPMRKRTQPSPPKSGGH
jgi:hypothetical protein